MYMFDFDAIVLRCMRLYALKTNIFCLKICYFDENIAFAGFAVKGMDIKITIDHSHCNETNRENGFYESVSVIPNGDNIPS